MTARARFKSADLDRVLRSVNKAGMRAAVEITPDGKIVILPVEPGAANDRRRNSLDRLHG